MHHFSWAFFLMSVSPDNGRRAWECTSRKSIIRHAATIKSIQPAQSVCFCSCERRWNKANPDRVGPGQRLKSKPLQFVHIVLKSFIPIRLFITFCLRGLWQPPLLPWQALFLSTLSLLVKCGCGAPILLCASKAASGKCHFKLHAARKDHAPS